MLTAYSLKPIANLTHKNSLRHQKNMKIITNYQLLITN